MSVSTSDSYLIHSLIEAYNSLPPYSLIHITQLHLSVNVSSSSQCFSVLLTHLPYSPTLFFPLIHSPFTHVSFFVSLLQGLIHFLLMCPLFSLYYPSFHFTQSFIIFICNSVSPHTQKLIQVILFNCHSFLRETYSFSLLTCHSFSSSHSFYSETHTHTENVHLTLT